MKSIRLLLTFSLIVSANFVNAQDEPAGKAADIAVEGKQASVEELTKKLKALQAKMEHATAKAALSAKQLQAKEQALAEYQEFAEVAKQQAEAATQQAKESLLRAEKAMTEAQQAKLSQELGIGQYKALLHLAEKKQGPEHSYSQALRAKLADLEVKVALMSDKYGPGHPEVAATNKQIKAIEWQLRPNATNGYSPALRAKLSDLKVKVAQMSEMYGPGHPAVVATEKQIKAFESQTQKVKPDATNGSGEVAAVKESNAANLKELQKKLEHAQAEAQKTNPEDAENERTQIAEIVVTGQQAADETRLKLAANRNAELLQRKRTLELMEMQNRLLSAEKIAENAAVAGQHIKPINTEQRFDRLEQKLDRIASLLEKLIDSKQ